MKEKRIVLLLAILAAVLLFSTSLAAILLDDGGNPYEFTSIGGEAVEIYGGQGIYQFDSVYKAVMFRGFDWLSLLVMVPLFVWGILLYQRGKWKGQLLLASLFTYLAYIYLIGVMGNVFNGLFFAWTALFSVGIFGLIFAIRGMDITVLPVKMGEKFPRKGVAIYVLALGAMLLVQYSAQIIGSYASAIPPSALEHYTTLELAALELGIMVPMHFMAGVLLWKKNAWGYLMSTLLAFAAATVFVALNTALIMLWRMYGLGGFSDIIMPLVIMFVAGGFSIMVFSQGKRN
jgi:hypothetical protein